MKLYLYTILFLTFTTGAIGQIKKGHNNISYVTLTDSTLINTINKVVIGAINSEDTDNLFKKGFGYIVVRVTKYAQKDTLRTYSIGPSSSYIRESASNNIYPDYYSIVNNKLVVIYLDGLRQIAGMQYSDKAKKKIRKLINNTLEKSNERISFYDSSGKKVFTDKHFRSDTFYFGGSYAVYIIAGKEPVIKETE